MPAEEFSYTGTEVASRVRSQFGDTSGAQLADSSILAWLNDGQREIVNSNPILRATKITDLVAGQSDYTFPSDKVLLIEAIYVDGYPITNTSPQAAREFIMTYDPKKTQTVERPEVWYERAGIITFFPVPNKSITNGLKLEYIKTPSALSSLSSTLSVPDRYFNELVNYVIAQALEMDENYSAAQYKHGQFRDGLDRLFTRDSQIEASVYSGILPDPDDFR
jgi:hypothetical protein